MPTIDELTVLGKELAADLVQLTPMVKTFQEYRFTLPESASQQELAYVGYLLHNIYTGWEGAFHRIAATFENKLDPAQWHTQLLARMSLDLSPLRPAVIDIATRQELETLRSFRHFFRYNYAAPLRQDRMNVVLQSFDKVVDQVTEGMNRFIAHLELVADESNQT